MEILSLLEGFSIASEAYKHFSTLVFGDKQEEYLKQIAADVRDTKTHIERLSDTILYAVNLDGVQMMGENNRYINNLKIIHQILEPLQKAVNQPILSSALVTAPPQIAEQRFYGIVRDISPYPHIVRPLAEGIIPVLFVNEGKAYVGWQYPAKLYCSPLSHWQSNGQIVPKINVLNDIEIFGEDENKRESAEEITEREDIFEFKTVFVDSQGKIVRKQKGKARQKIEKLELSEREKYGWASGHGWFGGGSDSLKNIELSMVYIEGGEFMMGASKNEKSASKDEYPQHSVTIKPFYMGKYPVTQAQWQAVMGNNPSRFKGDNRPVEKVSWNDAVKFCEKLSELTGHAYRLPSEAEWEYACRAGTTTPFHFGETLTTDLANYKGDYTYADLANYKGDYTYANESKGKYRGETTEVGSFLPNGFGLYDMHGNVWEWCADSWHSNYEGAPNDGSVWLNNSNKNRVLRGGSWNDEPDYTRSAGRNNLSLDDSDSVIGFRIKLT